MADDRSMITRVERAYEELRHTVSTIVIFGAGDVGRYALELCKKNCVSVEAFCDNNTALHGESICGKTVYSIDEINKKYGCNTVFIISVWDILQILSILKNYGWTEYYTMNQLYMSKDIIDMPFDLRKKLERLWYYHDYFMDNSKVCLRTLDFIVTERCSLKCKECSNLMQFYKSPMNFSFDLLKEELDAILRIYDEIYELRLLGGEPLVNPEIGRLVDYINSIDKIKKICIFTNGTIVPNEKTLLSIREVGKVWFSISDYHELSKKLRDLTAKLDGYGINYECKKIDYWTRCASFRKHGRTEEQLKRVYNECCARGTNTLLNKIISPCPFIANGINLRALPDDERDYVSIDGIDSIKQKREEIRSKIENRDYYYLCDYCTGRPYMNLSEAQKIPPHEQTKDPLAYEIIT